MKAFSIAVAVTLVLAFISVLESATVPLAGVSSVQLAFDLIKTAVWS